MFDSQMLEKTASYRQLIDEAIQAVFDSALLESATMGEPYTELLQVIAELVARGGKRLRPHLLLLAYEAYGGSNLDTVLPVAVSQELFHAFILMHDDVIDRDNRRWGGPNIRGSYLTRFTGQMAQSEAEHFAGSWSILAGDICYGLAQQAVTQAAVDPSVMSQTLHNMATTLLTMLSGELSDVTISLQAERPTTAQLMEMYREKTATYTFVTPLQLGAVCAHASEAELGRLKLFGENIGIAFQIQDDILGIFGDPAMLGKPVLADLREGKQTLLVIEALERMDTIQRAAFLKHFHVPVAKQRDLEGLRDSIRDCGALQATQALVDHYFLLADEQLEHLTMQPTKKQELAALVKTLQTRAT